MTVFLNELGFGIPADWLTPASRCFRPPSWPPARDWVVSETKDGRILSRWGDPTWDFTQLAGKPFKLNFGDGPRRIAQPIDPANADILRLIFTWLLWGHRPVKTAGTLSLIFQCIRPIIALCSNEGILASELMRFPKIFEKIPDAIASSSYRLTINRLHRLLDAHEKLGFILVDTEGLRRLAAACPDHGKIQTAYIPARIWTYQVSRLKECLDDYLKHRRAIDDCHRFCLDAYAQNYGSLSKALVDKVVDARRPFRYPPRPTAGYKSGCKFLGPFHLTAEQFGIHELLNKWLVCQDNQPGLAQLGSYLTLIQWVGRAYIANFTLQRIEEVATLRADCLLYETDEKLGRIPIICGETTKTIQDSDARWPTSPSVQIAVDALSHVAELRMRCINAHPFISLTTDEIDNPSLFNKSFDPWSRNAKAQHLTLTISGSAYQAVLRMFPQLFDVNELKITESDLQVARMLTTNLPEDTFAVGEVWPLAWHQLRRTGAVNMFASGMLSDSSIQFQMKHASRLMPLYYGRGYTKLHLNEEVEGIVTTAMYEVMAKSMLTAMGERFVSPRSADQKQDIVVNLIGDKDAKELAKAARQGDVFYRETRLGACTSRTLCTYGGIESVARCAGGDGHKPCADVLFDRAKAPGIEKELEQLKLELAHLPVESPRSKALHLERNALENFLDVVRS